MEFDMQPVADAIADRLGLDVPVQLFHSGGGCATISVGHTYTLPEYPHDQFTPVLLGPGSCSPFYPEHAVGNAADFYVGYDQDVESDGMQPYTVADPAPVPRPLRLVNIACQLYRDHPRRNTWSTGPRSAT